MCVTDQHQLGASSWAGKPATIQMLTQIQTLFKNSKPICLAHWTTVCISRVQAEVEAKIRPCQVSSDSNEFLEVWRSVIHSYCKIVFHFQSLLLTSWDQTQIFFNTAVLLRYLEASAQPKGLCYVSVCIPTPEITWVQNEDEQQSEWKWKA